MTESVPFLAFTLTFSPVKLVQDFDVFFFETVKKSAVRANRHTLHRVPYRPNKAGQAIYVLSSAN